MRFTREDTKAVKGIAIVLMFVHHLFGFPERLGPGVEYLSLLSWRGKDLAYVLGDHGELCVMLFIFLGGYGTYYACREKGAAEMAAGLWKKIKGLYLQYWQVLLVFVPICVLADAEGFPIDLMSLLWNFTGLRTDYIIDCWFITPYVMLMVTFPILYSISRRMSNVFSELTAVLLLNTFIRFALAQVLAGSAWMAEVWNSAAFSLLYEMLPLLPGFWLGCLFAKYDLLSKIKEKASGNYLYCAAGAIAVLMPVFLRENLGEEWDVVFAPMLTAGAVVALNCRPGMYLRKVLLLIGQESTFCWMLHGFFYLHLCQRFVYAAKYPVLIVVLLLVLCCATAKGLHLLYCGLGYGWKKIEKYLTFSPTIGG